MHLTVRGLPPENRRFEFDKSRQLFIGVRNETLSVAAVSINRTSKAPLVAKFIFASRITSLDSGERSADVAKWQTQRT